jgi:hypothetical protein
MSDQDNSAGDNKKIYNKNCDKARTCVKLGLKGGRNLCYEHNQQNQVHEHQCKKMGLGGRGECEGFLLWKKYIVNIKMA